MIILDATTKSVDLVLSGAVATNQPTFVSSYVDIASTLYSPKSQDGATNSAVHVAAVSAPAANVQRQIKLITVYNKDTAAVTVTVKYNNNGTRREIVSVTLAVGSTLVYTDGEGWRVITTSGQIVEISGINQLTGDVTAGPGYGSQAATLKTSLKKNKLVFVLENSGAVLTTGLKGFLSIPFDGTITKARLLADQAGSIVVDIYKDTYANFPPTVADSITAAAKPTISAAQKAEDSTLTGWTTSLAEGDVLGFNIDSVATVTRVEVELFVTRT